MNNETIEVQKKSKLIKRYENICEEIKDAFLKELYPDSPENYEDGYWIADEIGGCYSWGDWFVTINDMVDFFKYDFTSNDFFDWYDQSLGDDSEKKLGLNMRNYKKLKNI